MEKRKCLTFLFCLILCYSLFQLTARAQSSLQVTVISQGSITYPSSNVNLATITPINTFSLIYDPSYPQFSFLDSAIYYTNAPSIRIQPASVAGAREADGIWYNVKPGDHIVARCWIKVDALAGFVFKPNDATTWRGGRILVDLYGHGHWLDSHPQDGAEDESSCVSWGTSGWVLKTWDFIIPNTVYQVPVPYDPHPGGYTGPSQIDSIVMVLTCGLHGGALDRANGWFSDPVLYINPT